MSVSLPELISSNPEGLVRGNDQSRLAESSMSSDGRFMAFASLANNLVPDDQNDNWDVFLRDLELNTLTLVSRSRAGGTSDGRSDQPVISSDGQFVAFRSDSSDLLSTNSESRGNGSQVYRWSRQTGYLDLVSQGVLVSEYGNGESSFPSLNGDGSRVAFQSYASNLVEGTGFSPWKSNIYYRDFGSASTRLVSHSSIDVNHSSNGTSHGAPRLSRDGDTIVYTTNATDLEAGVTDACEWCTDLVRYDLEANANRYISVEPQAAATANAAANIASNSLSANGRFQVFLSSASNLLPGVQSGRTNVFLSDNITNTISLVTSCSSGAGDCFLAEGAIISANGDSVVFWGRSVGSLSDSLPNSVWSSQYSQVYLWSRLDQSIRLLSRSHDGLDAGNGDSDSPSVSENGEYITWRSRATNLVAGLSFTDDTGLQVYLAQRTDGQVWLVSHQENSPQQAVSGSSLEPSISRDGSVIVYGILGVTNYAGVSDANGTSFDLFSYDVTSRQNRIVNLASSLPTTGNAKSWKTRQAISADGLTEVFMSDASDLVPNDTNQSTDVFLRDTRTGQTILLSKQPNGFSSNGRSDHAVISADGNFVAFAHLHLHGDNDLEPTVERIIAPNTWQLYLWSRLTNKIELISHHWDNRTSGNGDSIAPSISEDGLHVAFLSSSTDLVSGVIDANLRPDVYVYSRLEEKNTLVSRSKKDSSLTANRGTEFPPQISRDGSTIAFLSAATDLTDLLDTNHDHDLFAWRLSDQRMILVNSNFKASGSSNQGAGENFSLSRSGRWIAFESLASDIVDASDDHFRDIYLRDLEQKTSLKVSENARYPSSSSGSSRPVISLDGRFVGFISDSSELVEEPLDGIPNAIVYDRLGDYPTQVVSKGNDDTPANAPVLEINLSGDSRHVAWTTAADNLDNQTIDENAQPDVFVRDWQFARPTTRLRSLVKGTNRAANGASLAPVLSDDGLFVLFSTRSTDMTELIDANGQGDDLILSQSDSLEVLSAKDTRWRYTFPIENYFVSNSGQFIAFGSTANGVADGKPVDNIGHVYVFDGDNLNLTRVTEDIRGVPFTSDSYLAGISGDGNRVLINSTLHCEPRTSDCIVQVYVIDRNAAQTYLISKNEEGDIGNQYSVGIMIDGMHGDVVLFGSMATNLDTNVLDENSSYDLLVSRWTSDSPQLTFLTTDRTHRKSANRISFTRAVMSDDGSTIPFLSAADDITHDSDLNGTESDLYLFQNGTNRLISRKDNSNRYTLNAPVRPPFAMSDDGDRIAFSINSWGIVDESKTEIKHSTSEQLYLYSQSQHSFQLIASMKHLSSIDSSSFEPSLDASGRYIAYAQALKGFNGDSIEQTCGVYVTDTLTQKTKRLSSYISPSFTTNCVGSPSISSDGQWLAFESPASELDVETRDENKNVDVFLVDWKSKQPTTRLISRNYRGNQSGNDSSTTIEISNHGKVVAFVSMASDLTATTGAQLVPNVYVVRNHPPRRLFSPRQSSSTSEILPLFVDALSTRSFRSQSDDSASKGSEADWFSRSEISATSLANASVALKWSPFFGPRG